LKNVYNFVKFKKYQTQVFYESKHDVRLLNCKFLKNIYFEISVQCTQACLIDSSSEGTGYMHTGTLWYIQFLCIFRILF
jgi:hypothetical protein